MSSTREDRSNFGSNLTSINFTNSTTTEKNLVIYSQTSKSDYHIYCIIVGLLIIGVCCIVTIWEKMSKRRLKSKEKPPSYLDVVSVLSPPDYRNCSNSTISFQVQNQDQDHDHDNHTQNQNQPPKYDSVFP